MSIDQGQGDNMGRRPSKIICLETGAIFNDRFEVARMLGCTYQSITQSILDKTVAQDNRTYIRAEDLDKINVAEYMRQAYRFKFRTKHQKDWYRCDQTGDVYASLVSICKYFGWYNAKHNQDIKNHIPIDGYTFTKIEDKESIEDYDSIFT